MAPFPMSPESQSMGLPGKVSASSGFSQSTPQALIPKVYAQPQKGIAPPIKPIRGAGAEVYREKAALQKVNSRPQTYI